MKIESCLAIVNEARFKGNSSIAEKVRDIFPTNFFRE